MTRIQISKLASSIRFLLIVGLMGVICFFNSLLAQTTVDGDCNTLLGAALKKYNELVSQAEMHIEYSHYQMVGEEMGDQLDHELWIREGKIKYENEFILFLQDEKHQIVLDKATRSILVRPAPEMESEFGQASEQFLNLPLGDQIDSVFTVAKSVQCIGKQGRIRVDFPATWQKKKMPIETMVWEVEPVSGKIIRQEYTYFPAPGEEFGMKDVYLYQTFETNVSKSDLPEDILTQVFKDQKLLPEYSDFELMDLRPKP